MSTEPELRAVRALPNSPFVLLSRRLRCAPPRPAALAPGCGPGGPTRHGAPGSESIHRSDRLIGSTDDEPGCEPSSSACQCPSRGHRVKGACGVARDRYATLDPPTAHQGFGAYEEDGGEAGTGPVEDQGVTVPKRPGATLGATGMNDLPVPRTHMNSEQGRIPGRGQI